MKLKAGNTLWTFGANAGLMSFEVISNRYNDQGGITVTCWNNMNVTRKKPQEICINRFGFVCFNNSYDRDFGVRTTEWWSKVYTTRRKALRRIKSGRPVVFSFDQIAERYSMERSAENLGLRLKFVPFHRKNIVARQTKIMDKLFADAEARREKEPVRQFMVRRDGNGKIITEEIPCGYQQVCKQGTGQH